MNRSPQERSRPRKSETNKLPGGHCGRLPGQADAGRRAAARAGRSLDARKPRNRPGNHGPRIHRLLGDIETGSYCHFGGLPVDFGLPDGAHFAAKTVPQGTNRRSDRGTGGRTRRRRRGSGSGRPLRPRASYLVGCDGGRELAGFGFPGTAATREPPWDTCPARSRDLSRNSSPGSGPRSARTADRLDVHSPSGLRGIVTPDRRVCPSPR